MNAEHDRLKESREQKVPWKKWGPYLRERQWGTVREDYSEEGDAWNFFPHDHSRSRAYRWGEDGLAGISDDKQRLCFALALWNGRDPILKERLFGLSISEGNHGEDVKEYYFYLDSTPTHSYMKYLYKYPQAAFPYDDLVATNRDRGRGRPEYELLDTGVFDQDRYFDIVVEYAKASPEDMLVRITVHNRGQEPAMLQLLPTLWFGNDWSWGEDVARPALRQLDHDKSGGIVALSHRDLGERFFSAEGASALNLYEVAEEIGRRLFDIFLKDAQGKRPVHGASRKFQEDPHWRDYPLFYEYFHGDTGVGIGASHQTGWSGAIARVVHLFASADAKKVLEQTKDKTAGGTLQPRGKRSA